MSAGGSFIRHEDDTHPPMNDIIHKCRLGQTADDKSVNLCSNSRRFIAPAGYFIHVLLLYNNSELITLPAGGGLCLLPSWTLKFQRKHQFYFS